MLLICAVCCPSRLTPACLPHPPLPTTHHHPTTNSPNKKKIPLLDGLRYGKFRRTGLSAGRAGCRAACQVRRSAGRCGCTILKCAGPAHAATSLLPRLLLPPQASSSWCRQAGCRCWSSLPGARRHAWLLSGPAPPPIAPPAFPPFRNLSRPSSCSALLCSALLCSARLRPHSPPACAPTCLPPFPLPAPTSLLLTPTFHLPPPPLSPQFPSFGTILLPLDPIIRLYYSFPLASLIVFFGVYLVGGVRGCGAACAAFSGVGWGGASGQNGGMLFPDVM